jgi:L-alanine-DL-glutamate epimerase-like enolase superfamily enzyme
MKITNIECHILLDPGCEIGATSSAQDDIVVEIHTDEGITGIGESDVNPWMAAACIEAPGTHTMGLGLKEMLLGADPADTDALWERMYVGSAMNGRRGVVIHAMGALDMALYDLRGKALGVPCYELLGGAACTHITPYASLQPEIGSFEAYRESLVAWALKAKSLGFTAAKAEITPCGPYAHRGLKATHQQMSSAIGDVRTAVGPDFVLMVDVQYAFPDADACLAAIRDWVDFNLYFVETPLPADDLGGYYRVATEQSIPIAAGEWLATRFEFLDLMDRGRVQVVQPDIGRVGGFTEARRVCDLARERGVTVVPHLWKTGISIAAAAHLAAATPHCAFIEYLPTELCESKLRKDLAATNLVMRNGKLSLPEGPGLGIELNREALLEFKALAARRTASAGLVTV